MNKSINWNQASELGLIERINTEILHPLGLAMARDPNTGVSDCLFVAPDGAWEYDPDRVSKILTDSEVKKRLGEILK